MFTATATMWFRHITTRRAGPRLRFSGSQTHVYFHEGQNLIAEADESGDMLWRYVYGTTYIDERAIMLSTPEDPTSVDTYYYLRSDTHAARTRHDRRVVARLACTVHNGTRAYRRRRIAMPDTAHVHHIASPAGAGDVLLEANRSRSSAHHCLARCLRMARTPPALRRRLSSAAPSS